MDVPRPLTVPFLALPWIVAVCIIVWVVVNRVPPSGIFTASSTMDGQSAFINPFLPSERVTVPGPQADGWTGQRITGDPTYMTTRVPGPYERVDVEVEFRPLHQPLLEFGIVRDAAGLDLDLAPMYAETLMSSVWKPIEGGFARAGADARTIASGDTRILATWDATTSMPLMDDPAGEPIETKVSLRGSHDFYLVPADGNIDITFGIQDVNRNEGSTTVAFRVFRDDVELKRDAAQTNASKETAMGKVTEHRIRLDGVGRGVIRVAFQATDDVFIRRISTTSRRWVVGPRLVFGDVVGYATTTTPGIAWTTSRHLVAETFHREGEQEVTLGDLRVHVEQAHESYRLDRIDTVTDPVRLLAPAGDIRFVGDGWFALREDAFFEPKPKRFTDATDPAREGIVAVATPFERPTDLGDGWYRATFRYDIDPSMDRLRFVLSAPGIASRMGAVDIRHITVAYRRPALSFERWWMILRQEVINAWRRL
ncbi:hypothetical protein KJ781_00920 [Patescibacteria group bacterium]|nr:hypothetical protein [Patescibacteria group bacterium]MBU1448237.1 hypothetical protein [Patescibacteria group bacterium]MBU2613491.1 hypothetical protein [Patescibacteria group bacterium]